MHIKSQRKECLAGIVSWSGKAGEDFCSVTALEWVMMPLGCCVLCIGKLTQLLHSQFRLLVMCLGGSRRWPHTWLTVTYVDDLSGVPGY